MKNKILLYISLFMLGTSMMIPIFTKEDNIAVGDPVGVYKNLVGVLETNWRDEDYYYLENGEWQTVNLEIKDVNEGDYAYLVDETWYDVYFAERSNTGIITKFINDGCEFTYSVEEMLFRDENGDEAYIDNLNAVDAIKGDSIHYINILPYIDAEYIPTPKSVKEIFRVNYIEDTPPAWLGDNVTFDIAGYIKFGENITIRVNGENAPSDFVTSDSIFFIADGKPVYELTSPWAIDSLGNNVTCYYEVKKSGNNYWFYTRVPYDWIENATFPIFIDPTLNTVEVYDAAGACYGITAADVDDDGDGDIIITDDNIDDVLYYNNTNGDGRTWGISQIDSSLSGNPRGCAVGDLDNDGDKDVVAHSYSTDDIKWYENDGDEGWTEHAVDGLGAGRTDMYDHEILVDMDEDNYLDIVIGDYADQVIVWLHNDQSPADGGWTEYTIASSFVAVRNFDVEDLDEDGDLDIVAGSYTDGLAWFENDGTPLDGGWTEHSISASGHASAVVIDIDGDGDFDVAAGTYESVNPDAIWYKNDGSENFKAYNLVDTNGGDTVLNIEAVDIDGDDDIDIFLANYDSKNHSWCENDGTNNFTQHLLMGVAEDRGTDNFVYDIDNDGWDDVILCSRYNVTWVENTGTNYTASWQKVAESYFRYSNTKSDNNKTSDTFYRFLNTKTDWNKTSESFFRFLDTGSDWNKTSEAFFRFSELYSEWNKTVEAWYNFKNSKSEWNKTTDAFFRFAEALSDWNKTAEGWFGFQNTKVDWNKTADAYFRFQGEGDWQKIAEAYYRFLNFKADWNKTAEGYWRFLNTGADWNKTTETFFRFLNTKSDWNKTSEAYFRFAELYSAWNKTSEAWVKFLMFTNPCFTGIQIGNTVWCDASCSNVSTNKTEGTFKWSVEFPDGTANTTWTNDTSYIVSCMEEGRMYITLTVRNATGAEVSCTQGFTIGEPRDRLEYWEYTTRASCEGEDYYWWDNACHCCPEGDPWDDWGEGDENRTSPDEYYPSLIDPGTWNFPPELMIIPIAIIFLFYFANNKYVFLKKRNKNEKRIYKRKQEL